MDCAVLAKRIIARLDVKAPNLVKGIRLEGFRVLGKPEDFALRYEQQGIDEIMFVDVVASLYGRNSMTDVIARTADRIFIPLGASGGIRSLADATALHVLGMEKVALNTAAIARPQLLTEIARRFGCQAVALSVEAKRTPKGWECYTDNGREKTGLDVIEWVKRGVDAGAGEVQLTSVDRDGTRKGLDLELVEAVVEAVPQTPVVASGGVGSVADVADGFAVGAAGVAVGTLLHYGVETVGSIKAALSAQGHEIREVAA